MSLKGLINYQVYPGKKDILRLRRTVDAGAPSIQLFDTEGNQLQEFKIAPMGILKMTSIKVDYVKITYLIGQSDLEMFLPWFRTNKFNPEKVGRYIIRYNYEIFNEYLEAEGSLIDSMSVNKKTGNTCLFQRGKFITEKPTFLFIIKSSEVLGYTPITKEYTRYPFEAKNLAQQFSHKVLNLYNN